ARQVARTRAEVDHRLPGTSDPEWPESVEERFRKADPMPRIVHGSCAEVDLHRAESRRVVRLTQSPKQRAGSGGYPGVAATGFSYFVLSKLETSIRTGSAVLLLGNYRPTITLVRELKALSYAIIVGRGGGEGGAEYSRFTDEIWDHPELEESPDAFLLSLRSFLLRRSDIGVVFPVAEGF